MLSIYMEICIYIPWGAKPLGWHLEPVWFSLILTMRRDGIYNKATQVPKGLQNKATFLD